MSDRQPTGYQIEQAMSVLLAVRQRLLEDDPDLASDERLFADMLEGESGDAMDVLHRILRAAVYAEGMASAAEARATEIEIRRDRYRHRAKSLRGAAFAAMDALALRKIELPDLTASIKTGQSAVVITDEAALPETMVRTERKPDKALIGATLKAGIVVPGAGLNNSLPSIQIRTK